MNKRFFNVIKGVILSKFGYRIPLRVMHFVTYRCNLSCKYCGIWSYKIKEMNTSEAKRAIKEFADAGTFHWVFTGGEPLLRTDIKELIDYLKDFGIAVTLTTNGTLLKEKIKEVKNVDYLVVSLDGPKEINDEVRGNGVFDKVVEGVREARKEGIEVVLNTTLSRKNIENNFYGIKEMIRIAKSLDARLNFSVIYKDIYNQRDQFHKNRIDTIFPSREELIKALDFIKEQKKRTKNLILFSDPNIEQLKKMNKWKKCYAGILFVDLLPDGRVIPCLFKPHLGINGLEKGFVNAFKSLPIQKNCVCPSTCYNELNCTFSLYPKSVWENFIKYMFLVKK
jgi:MoaA/NifB/PqqE/SkfB family radical SAM enzyme